MDAATLSTKRSPSSRSYSGGMRKSKSSKSKRRSRKYFHRVARGSKLGAISEGPLEDGDSHETTNDFMAPRIRCQLSGAEHKHRLRLTKEQLLRELAAAGGDPMAPQVKEILDRLISFYNPSSFDPKEFMTPVTMKDDKLEDMWLTLSKLELKGCLGNNARGDGMYTLGRMAFDMFRPTKLICSIQGCFNEIDIVDGTDEDAVKHVPRNLEADVRDGQIPARTYNIITAFTIEPYDPETMGPNSPNKGVEKPIQAIMTLKGYAMPYPKQNTRYSIWFSGGSIQVISDPNKQGKQDEWHHIFSQDNMPQRTFVEKANVFVAGLLLGATTNEAMDSQGKMSYHMKRPIAAYIDMLFMDETLRIMRGSSGTIYVLKRAPKDEGTLSVSSWGSESDCCSLSGSGDSSVSSLSGSFADKQSITSLDVLPGCHARGGSSNMMPMMSGDALPTCPSRQGIADIPEKSDTLPTCPRRHMSEDTPSRASSPRSVCVTPPAPNRPTPESSKMEAPRRPSRSYSPAYDGNPTQESSKEEAPKRPSRSCSPTYDGKGHQFGSRRGRRPSKVNVSDSCCPPVKDIPPVMSQTLPSHPTTFITNIDDSPGAHGSQTSATQAPRRPNRSCSPKLEGMERQFGSRGGRRLPKIYVSDSGCQSDNVNMPTNALASRSCNITSTRKTGKCHRSTQTPKTKLQSQ